jgi:hypothetical protein
MRDLAVVIVTWNVRALVIDALTSLHHDLAQSGLSAEVIVVDSASSDGTPAAVAEIFPQVCLIASEKNLGFGAANNVGLRAIGFDGSTPSENLPRAVYLLNPDTIVQPGSTRALFDALMANSSAGLVGARLSYGDGSFQHSAFRFPGLRQLWVEFFPTPGRWVEGGFNGRYPRARYDHDQPFEIDFPLGATMMLRREVIQQSEMFDEAFFMYCEEIDWAWRIHHAGWKVLCVPTAHVVHLGGQSTGQVRPLSVIYLWSSRLRLFRKHYPGWKWLLARGLIIIGMWLRKRRASRSADADVAQAYQRVIRMARAGQG